MCDPGYPQRTIIFILGWPLEWTEIIVIFMPLFIPLLAHFNIDPLFFGFIGGVESTNGVPDTTGGDGGVLSKRGRTTACHAEPNFRRHDAVHGDSSAGDGAALYVACYRHVAAVGVA